MSDLDNEELQATRELNGTAKAVSTEDELKQLQEDNNKKIEEAVAAFNKACEDLAALDIVHQVICIGYIDTAISRGFVSAQSGLESLESTTTFLLDFSSNNIREQVKARLREQAVQLKEQIKREENKDNEK